MKKITASLLAFLMLFSVTTSAFALESDTVIDYGDGYYMVLHDVTYRAITRSQTEYSADADFYNGSTHIGKATLYGEFSYNGSSASALAGSTSGSGYNGWSYKSGSASCSKATVTGTFYFSKGTTTSPKCGIEMTCSPIGRITVKAS